MPNGETLNYWFKMFFWLVGQGIAWIIFAVKYVLWFTGIDLSKGKHLWTAIVIGLMIFTRPDADIFLRISGYVKLQFAAWWGQHPYISTLLIGSVIVMLFQEKIVSWGTRLREQEAPEEPETEQLA